MAKGKPNIFVIWGDDIGMSNLSIFSKGMMATGRLISIKSPRKEFCLPILWGSRVAGGFCGLQASDRPSTSEGNNGNDLIKERHTQVEEPLAGARRRPDFSIYLAL